jgi:hypothetical protein
MKELRHGESVLWRNAALQDALRARKRFNSDFAVGRVLSAEIAKQIIAYGVVAEGGDLGRAVLCHARADRGQRPRL